MRQLTETQAAIVELRHSLGWTQQQLAVHLNRTVVTVARWETMRPPRGLSLVELFNAACEFQRFDLADVFRIGMNGAEKRWLCKSEGKGL